MSLTYGRKKSSNNEINAPLSFLLEIIRGLFFVLYHDTKMIKKIK